MSTNHNGVSSRKRNGGKAEAKSVRFAQNDEPSSSPPPTTRRKRPRIERPNEDEEDDVDDWVDDEEHVGASSKELLEAKRSRRLKREHLDENDVDKEETHIDATTSLIADDKPDENDVPIEPFNMDAERTDGSGYFEGDTYVFRKRGEEEEPDAWVESLEDDRKLPAKQKSSSEDESSEAGDNLDEWNREELYAKLIPLVSDSETILQALIRYGELIKRQDKQKSAANNMAQEALNSLTEASNALLLKGDVDIYQKTRKDLMKLVPSSDNNSTKKESLPVVQWEYRGNQDGKLHGPYTTEQMKSWTGAGYFVGEQAVQIRTVAASSSSNEQDQKPTVDDLLSDLMDDDDNNDQKGESLKEVRGEWMSSNDVDFSKYA